MIEIPVMSEIPGTNGNSLMKLSLVGLEILE